MRQHAYRLFEIVAWPAAAWCLVEVGLRLATTSFDGLAMTAATGSMAALTILGCRMRVAQLVTSHR